MNTYDLLSDKAPTNIKTIDDLRKEILGHSLSTEIEGQRPVCIICCGNDADVATISRSCLCSERPCEGHTCNCTKPYPVCCQCVTTQLWENTNSIMKERQQFRSHCALCKAEFCSQDIVLLPRAALSATQTTPKKQNTPRKKKHKPKK